MLNHRSVSTKIEATNKDIALKMNDGTTGGDTAVATNNNQSGGRSASPNERDGKQKTTKSSQRQPRPWSAADSDKCECVLEVLQHDVLLGRGSGPNDHVGNIKFRDLVHERKSDYLSTNHRQTKALIARDIVDQVYARGGRFLKKLNPVESAKMLPKLLAKKSSSNCGSSSNNDDDVDDDPENDFSDDPDRGSSGDVYQIQKHATVMEKAKQALRQNQRNGSLSPTGQRSGTPTKGRSPGLSGVLAMNTNSNANRHSMHPPRTNKISPDPPPLYNNSSSSNNNNNNNVIDGRSQSSKTEKSDGKTRFADNRNDDVDDEDDEEEKFVKQKRKEQLRALAKAQDKGITVVSAFEGYAFDYGMRTGDRLTKVDDLVVEKGKTTVEDVRNVLRGTPGTLVNIQFERDGLKGVQEVTMPRTVVRLRDVKLATLVGKPSDGIGYISLSGFAQSAGNEVRGAILALEQAAEDASNGEHSLKGLVLDLRGNPGGLLTSAVDVASLLVPNGSDIVSAKGRGFPGVTYRSRTEPLLDKNTKLAVLVNRGTASAAEIVSGAVQDLDVGIIVGTDRTFGKGLVQNVEDLPFNTALKFTVAKYYTPSGRCIQSVNYKEGGIGDENDGKYTASRVSQKDRQVFYTKSGRTVRDGGGVEADYKVAAPKASALEITLLRSDVMNEYASQWSQKYQLTNNFEVTDDIYKEFQDFVDVKSKAGEIKLEAIYSSALDDLKRALSQSGYKASENEVEQLKTQIVKEVKKDFEKYKKDIKEDIATSILSRYIPESMIMERSLKTDRQVEAAIKLLGNDQSFSKILAKGSTKERALSQGNNPVKDSSMNVALEDNAGMQQREGGSFRLEF